MDVGTGDIHLVVAAARRLEETLIPKLGYKVSGRTDDAMVELVVAAQFAAVALEAALDVCDVALLLAALVDHNAEVDKDHKKDSDGEQDIHFVDSCIDMVEEEADCNDVVSADIGDEALWEAIAASVDLDVVDAADVIEDRLSSFVVVLIRFALLSASGSHLYVDGIGADNCCFLSSQRLAYGQ